MPCPVIWWNAHVESCQEDIKVDPVLPTAATSCSLKEEQTVPLAEYTGIYRQEEWVLIQQKDPDLMQVQRSLFRHCKPYSCECQRLSDTA